MSAGPVVQLPTAFGDFQAQAWTDETTGAEHLSISAERPAAADSPTGATGGAERSVEMVPLVRLHSECLTGDVFGSYRCDCGEQLAHALRRIRDCGGTLIYLRGHEGRGIGLANKLRAYALQEAGADTVEANEQLGLPVDSRDYAAAAGILAALGLHRIRLLSNNPLKRSQLAALGIEVAQMVPVQVPSREQNVRYLRTKRDRMNHTLNLPNTPAVPAVAVPAIHSISTSTNPSTNTSTNPSTNPSISSGTTPPSDSRGQHL
ncbi:GTP cyclohydrolase II [Arthrobacter sp. H14-L1]|uniref:GTP cyclohydrolase II n=1 Tax=Arthrobacter sp. H14-L1 TaxID=2996697 RepID=UPI00226E09E0|nr:GTP cyclohydrolase II [Arthrobacter sp. H14-L1]MCY0904349.1 GTP cyclohydrolase II [Arthrobacter sp. H14-L1]